MKERERKGLKEGGKEERGKEGNEGAGTEDGRRGQNFLLHERKSN